MTVEPPRNVRDHLSAFVVTRNDRPAAVLSDYHDLAAVADGDIRARRCHERHGWADGDSVIVPCRRYEKGLR